MEGKETERDDREREGTTVGEAGPTMFALRTDVHLWRSAFQCGLDEHMAVRGIELVDLPWAQYELLPHDRDHFTWEGYVAFSRGLAHALRACAAPDAPVHVYADSTVDYWNWDAKGNWTGRASTALAAALAAVHLRASIDAVNGSGFVARHEERLDFRSRRRAAAEESGATVVVIGGWNDRHWPLPAVRGRVDAFLRPVGRGRRR